MAFRSKLSRQRVPMLGADTLEGRTRPALDGSAVSRLRYVRWSSWARADMYGERVLRHQQRVTQARLGRR